MPRKPSRKTLSNKADRLWWRAIRSKGFCELAGLDQVQCGGPHQAAHIVGRRYRVTRWDLNNGLCLCRDHHVFYTHRPELWYVTMERIWPGRYHRLVQAAQGLWNKVYPIAELEEALEAANGA